jgi:hypothetical protein
MIGVLAHAIVTARINANRVLVSMKNRCQAELQSRIVFLLAMFLFCSKMGTRTHVP